MLASSSPSEAGQRLRAERERLRLTTRDVERLSKQIAEEEKSRAYFIAHNTVSDIENGRFTPGLRKSYSLSVIYGWDIEEILSLFGFSLRNSSKEHGLITLPHTHLVRTASSPGELTVPVAMRPKDKIELERTNLIHRMRASWAEISLSLLQQAGPKDSLYGYIGTEDYTLDPLIRPGSIVQIDSRQTKIQPGGWISEYHRPIYFFELRNNHYACSWCELNGTRLLLIPSPRSRLPIQHLRYPQDADIIGRVTAVAMRIAEPPPDL